jgi:hypothetical protein
MLHTLSRLSVRLLGAIAIVATAAACPGIGDIDRTQPEKVKKSIFFKDDGKTPAEFYFRQTVIDVPATNGVTFIGEQGDTERVVFEVTQDFLFAYRSYGWLENDTVDGPSQTDNDQGPLPGNQGDGYVRPGTGPYHGTPIAAFRILGHFDIKRQYNPSTGEQTNVIYEDGQDRPWYQREYMRVDWTTNQIADFRFGSATVLQTPASVSVPEEDNTPDAQNERPIITSDYIDVVTKFNVNPEAIDLSYYGYGMVPECYFSSSMYKDCLGGTIKVRSSFRRLPDEGSDYLPLDYDDLRFQKFGFFRTERFAYDDEYGIVEPAQVRLANRWNIWKDAASCYDPEADLPYSACRPDQLRTIVYYLNADFPKEPSELRKAALENGDQWNALLREAVKASTGWSDAELGDHRMFTLCPNNPVEEGDPEECGPAGLSPQIGDLRYSMYYYVPNYQDSSPLGYGPSAADPLTGEIIQANAFYYAEAGGTIAARTRDIVKLQLGLISEEDITGGIPAHEAVAAAKSALAADSRVREFPPDFADKARDLAKKLKIKENGQRLRQQIDSGVALHDKRAGRTEALKNSGIDELVVNDEMREVFGRALLEEGVDPSQADSLLAARLFDDDAMFRRSRLRQERLLTPAAGGCILSAEDVFDDALLGLAAAVRSKFYDTTTNPPTLKDGFTDADVYNFILAETLSDTQLHEVGHTMGLRHNFAGSTDALNYGPKYWELRGLVKTSSSPRPAAEWEIGGSLADSFQLALDSGLRENQDASIMDYSSAYARSHRDLGLYDLAAIKYAYGDVVEVFNSPDMTEDKAALLRQGELHYTYYPEVVSNAGSYDERVAALYDRRNVNFRKAGGNGAVEVPYSFCSDEYRDASATCAIWDQGADNFERTHYAATKYRNYSIFSNFKRERLTYGLDIYAYLSRVYTVDMTYILNQYKNWVNDELIIRNNKPCLAVENGQIVKVSDDRFAADQCGLAGFLGTVEAINLFGAIIEQPDVGCYARLKPGCYDTVVGNASPGSVPDSADITLVDANPDACDSYVPTQPANPDADRRVALKITATSPFNHVPDTTTCEGYTNISDLMEDPIEINLTAGGGRPANTLYDRDRYGYYFYNKPVTIGSWWDKWLAVKALGDPNTDFIGVDASSDTRSFLISLNTLFGDNINNVIGGAVTDNVNVYGPVVNESGDDVEILPVLDINTGGAIDRTVLNRPVINPDQQYTFRLLAMMNAAYNGQVTDSFEFGESLSIGSAYNLTNTDIPDAVRADPSRYTEVTDPVSGVKWFALNQKRAGADDLYSVGFNFLREIKDRYYVGGADGPGTTLLPAYQGQFEFQPRQDLEIARIMASTAAVFGYADVWSGDIEF